MPSTQVAPPAATPPPEWPPSSLAVNSEWIAADCEDLQVAGNSDAAVLIVHMAALLHAQKWNAAQHLYRRFEADDAVANNLQLVLDPWYRVAAAALQGQWTQIETALRNVLQHCGSSKDTPPVLVPLIPNYVQEISRSFRESCCQPWVHRGRQPPVFLAHALLGGQQEQGATIETTGHASGDISEHQQETQRMVSFLESRIAAPSAPPWKGKQN